MLKDSFIPGAIGLLLCVVLAACADHPPAGGAGGANQPADSKSAPVRPTTSY